MLHPSRLLVSLLVFATPIAGFAQAPPSPSAPTQAGLSNDLFSRGQEAMKAGDYAKACPAFEESYALDPTLGKRLASGECARLWGKTATALARFQQYLIGYDNLSPELRKVNEANQQMAQGHAQDLEKRVPKVTLRWSAGAHEGAKVALDGSALSDASLQVEFSIDPGEHVLTTELPGGPVRRETFSIGENERKTIDLKVDPAPPIPSATATVSLPPTGSAPVVLTASPAPHPYRVPALAIGGVGVVGLILGSVTGGVVLDLRSRIEQGCIGVHCTPDGKSAADTAQALAAVSTVGFALGLAGLVTGNLLWWAGSPSSAAEKKSASGGLRFGVSASPSGGHLGVGGAF